jgi:hypothetical protein
MNVRTGRTATKRTSARCAGRMTLVSARRHLVHGDVTIEHLESRLASALSNGDVATAQQLAKQIIEHQKDADASS